MARSTNLSPEDKARAEAIGDRIRRCRSHRKMTRAAVAVKADVSVDHLGALERGENLPHDRTLNRIAAALGSTPEYLRTGRGKRKAPEGGES